MRPDLRAALVLKMDGVLQSPPPAQSHWQLTTIGSLIIKSRSNATRASGADLSLKSPKSCPKNEEHLSGATRDDLGKLARRYNKNDYGRYLKNLGKRVIRASA